MTITPKRPTGGHSYDWFPLIEAAIGHPGEWVNDDSADVPKTNAHAIRRGMPKALSPAGAFDAVVRKREGIYLRYLGIPIEPWVHFDTEVPFADVKRTFDPALFPDGTPDRFIQFAPDPDDEPGDAPMTLAEAEALSKAKKKAKKKHGHA